MSCELCDRSSHPNHVMLRDALCDGHDKRHLCFDGLKNRRGGTRGRYVNDRSVRVDFFGSLKTVNELFLA